MNSKRTRRKIRVVMALFAISFMSWQLYSMQAKNVDGKLLLSGPKVNVESSEAWIGFAPVVDTMGVGLLFYPGALVDPIAYVPMARAVAEAGFEAVIVKVPYRINLMEWQREAVEASTRELAQKKDWVLGGHSRGARLALSIADKYASELAGLLLVGTSHPREEDHSGLGIPVMKVYGSEDGLASVQEIEQFRGNLPDHTQWELIEGGNHAQFAWYGSQFGDDTASITREEQQEALVNAILTFLNDLR